MGRDHAAGQRVVGPPADAASRCRGRRRRRRARAGAPAGPDRQDVGDPGRLGAGCTGARRGRRRGAGGPVGRAGPRPASWPGRARRRTAGRWATSPCSRSAPSSRRRSRGRCCASWEPGSIKVEPIDGEPMRIAAALPRGGRGEMHAGKGVDLRRPVDRRGPRHRARAGPAVRRRAAVVPGRGGRDARASTPTRCAGSTRTSSTSMRRATGSTDPAATAPRTRRPSVPAAVSSCATSAQPSRSDRVCRCGRSGPTPYGWRVRVRPSTPRPTGSRR